MARRSSARPAVFGLAWISLMLLVGIWAWQAEGQVPDVETSPDEPSPFEASARETAGYETTLRETSAPETSAHNAGPQEEETPDGAEADKSKTPDRPRDTNAPAADGREQAGDASIPLTHVVMYTSGVSYYEHAAEVQGNARLQLKMPPEDVNDLLKSLVVEDCDGGHLATVRYESKVPVSRVLETFAIDLSQPLSLADLIGQLRGHRVHVQAPTPATGTVVSVTERQRAVGDGEQGDDKSGRAVLTIHVLNLRTDSGLKSIPFPAIESIRLEEPELDRELDKALQVLARNDDTRQKSVTLLFEGQHSRRVRVGYLRQSPVWKMTYRLALRDSDSPESTLQGWAIVENQVGNDWDGVQVTLVSGEPITFVMPLYDPLYVDRPEIQLDLYEGLRPQTYGQDLAQQTRQLRAERKVEKQRRATAAPAAADRNATAARGVERADKLSLRDGIRSAAQASAVGELFEYRVEKPVSLARHESAMLPVINQTLEVEKVTIYDPTAHASHPLNGARVHNDSDLYLMKGPVTVFDEGRYAGDAILEPLQPGAERLITYALDTEVEVDTSSASQPERILTLSMIQGTLHLKYLQRESQTYTAKNRGTDPRKLLIVHPKRSGWELVAPEEPAATTADNYRFALSLRPGESRQLEVRQERVLQESIAFTNLTDDALIQYLRAEAIRPEVKKKLREVIDRKQKIEQLETQLKNRRGEIDEIAEQQSRIRQNMQQLDKTSELYQRYVDKLSRQEDRLEELTQAVDKLEQQIQQSREELNEFLSGWELEAGNEDPSPK